MGVGGVYHPRRPRESAFYKLVERFFPQFEAVYEERYQERYGFWRPIIGTVVRKFLECGNLKHGFARVRCPECREEFFVPYSCRGRCFCPSCHQKRALEKAGWVAEHVCAEVPHRQFVFTIPKRLRIYFRFDRRLQGDPAAAGRAAARTGSTSSGITAGIRIPQLRDAVGGPNHERRRRPERGFPPARPRRVRPAKAGRLRLNSRGTRERWRRA